MKSYSTRTKLIFQQIGNSSIYKAFSIIINFFLVPLSISYLGSEQYGLWLTIFSFIGWFSFFDFGIGNGLRNKLASSMAIKDVSLSKAYVSTAYFGITSIILFVLLLSIIPFYLIPWDTIFNYKNNNQSIGQVISVVFIIFSVNLVLKMITSIYYADQNSSMSGLIQLLGQIIIVIGIYIALQISTASLLLYASIVLGSQMLVLLLVTIIAFCGRYRLIRPSIKAFDKNLLNDILSLGGKFFLMQITYIIIISTDNFIINYFLGAQEVTIFNIAFKYFMIATMGMSIITEPYWSAFTNAAAQGDIEWIKESVKNLLKISIFMSFAIIFMVFSANIFYELWIGKEIIIPFELTILIGCTTILQVFVQVFIIFINGYGKLKVQLYLGVLLAIINIFLSVLFISYYDFGVISVVIATLITRVVELLVYQKQVFMIINEKAYGIWNQ